MKVYEIFEEIPSYDLSKVPSSTMAKGPSVGYVVQPDGKIKVTTPKGKSYTYKNKKAFDSAIKKAQKEIAGKTSKLSVFKKLFSTKVLVPLAIFEAVQVAVQVYKAGTGNPPTQEKMAEEITEAVIATIAAAIRVGVKSGKYGGKVISALIGSKKAIDVARGVLAVAAAPAAASGPGGWVAWAWGAAGTIASWILIEAALFVALNIMVRGIIDAMFDQNELEKEISRINETEIDLLIGAATGEIDYSSGKSSVQDLEKDPAITNFSDIDDDDYRNLPGKRKRKSIDDVYLDSMHEAEENNDISAKAFLKHIAKVYDKDTAMDAKKELLKAKKITATKED